MAIRTEKVPIMNLQDCKDKVTGITKKLSGKKPTSESMKQLEKILDNIELIFQRDEGTIDIKILAATINSIKTALDEMRKHIAEQDANIENLAGIVETLTESVATLTEKLAISNERVKQLEKIEIDLLFGQIVSKANHCIVDRIVEGTGISRKKSFITINSLEKAVKGQPVSRGKYIFKEQSQIERANENWEKLDDFFSLDWNDYEALNELRITRNITAHPNMTLEEARRHIAETRSSSIPRKEKEMGLRLLHMLEQMSVTQV